ncbi:hypothetical protein BCU85_06140 [Vibrio lentus]|uniref:hypothetical protein n=2 Tax=Vibrio lentus TaxID=136468 RepID=UPI000C843FE7|nr:hypothetical protein [Vibrio lentus]MCC4816389.1 hypothetical protein [Vibrio lentus]PMG69727.1 hypothetical protein BCU85_06140 [Vibrio lentus]PMK90288.1 hypothetical protein BCT88_19955 [Vibrio lentus]PML20389.1 hypothetical protein BCT80_18650 [Vibrio lentus]PMM25353.1 hypothetical protein BCT57_22475 [Vibrio lentus]
MSYVEFFDFAYLNIDKFILFTLLILVVLYFPLRNFAVGGLLDPFHFTFTFTYATSYSVVVILFMDGYVSNYHFMMIFLYAILFVSSLYIFQTVRLTRIVGDVYRTLIPKNTERIYVNLIVILYIILVSLVMKSKGFSLFTDINRFEDNRGIGPLVKFLNLLTYFLVAFISIKLYELRRRRFFYVRMFFFVAFILFNSILGGAKSAVLFYVMASVLSVSVYSNEFKISLVKFVLVISLSVIFVFVVLAFNFSAVIDLSTGNTQVLIEALSRRFMDRILSNGDSYYMGLPYNVIEEVELNNVLVVFFTPLISNTIMSKLAGFDVALYDLGKQFLINLYPDMTRAGGPTDHFDLFAYKYFGVLLGGFFVSFLAFWLCQIRKILIESFGDSYKSAVSVVLWISSLTILLKPGMILGDLMIFLFLFMFIKSFGDLISSICVEKLNI